MTDAQDTRERWAMVLGSSSGFGGAAAKALAGTATTSSASTSTCAARGPTREAVRDEIAADGRAGRLPQRQRRGRTSGERRSSSDPGTLRGASGGGRRPILAVFLHSLAFGTTLSYVRPTGEDGAQAEAARDDGRRHGPLDGLLGARPVPCRPVRRRQPALRDDQRRRPAGRPDLRRRQRRQGRPRVALPPAGHGAHAPTASRSTASAPASPIRRRCGASRADEELWWRRRRRTRPAA